MKGIRRDDRSKACWEAAKIATIEAIININSLKCLIKTLHSQHSSAILRLDSIKQQVPSYYTWAELLPLQPLETTRQINDHTPRIIMCILLQRRRGQLQVGLISVRVV